MPQIWADASGHPTTCDGCGKSLSIEHAISCPKVGLVMVRKDDAAKEWGALGARALIPSAIPSEPKSIVVQYRGRGPGPERSKEVEQPTAAQIQ